MKRPLIFIASFAALGAPPAFAQTADHAPTKPAADAAARYDKSQQTTSPGKNTGDSASGPSTGTTGADPSPGNSKPGTDGAPAQTPSDGTAK